MEKQVYNAVETGLFYKDVGKHASIMQLKSKVINKQLLGFKSFKDHVITYMQKNIY